MARKTTQVLAVGMMLAAGDDRLMAQTQRLPETRELSANRESGAMRVLQPALFVVPMTGADPTRLAVRLSIDQDGGLSALQLRLAIDEVREIWSDVGVSIASGRYGELSRLDEATISLRILLSPAPHRDGAEWVLVWVAAIEAGRTAPLLFVSVPAVTEAVMGADASGRPVTKLTRGLRDRLIARAIGRVTAHELGHYLLENAGHQDRGLMRANYSSSDLVGSWLGPFRVLTAQRPVVRQKIAALARLQAPFGDVTPESLPRL
jgi:hypothetical protein